MYSMLSTLSSTLYINPGFRLLMQARILRNQPPGEDWDGVFTRREE